MQEEGDDEPAFMRFTPNQGAAKGDDFRGFNDTSSRSRTQSVIFLDKLDTSRPSRANSVDSDKSDRASNPMVNLPTKVVAYADNELLCQSKPTFA